jgi:hypothetical protein
VEEIMEDIIRCIAKNRSSEDELFECVKKGASETQYGLNRYILNKSIEGLIVDGYIKKLDDQYILEDKAEDFLQSNKD